MRPLFRALVAGLFLTLPTLADAQQTKWYLAEGSTGPFFEEEILAVNPTSQTASGFVRIFKDGVAIDQPFAIPAHRRISLLVNSVPGLQTGETSALIDTSASGVPIFVERTMYWLGRQGGHNAGGVEAASQTWYLAEGATGTFFNTFILMVNPNPSATNVTLSLLKDDGTRADVTYVLAANSRQTIYVNQLPGFTSANFASMVTATQPVFVERAMYWMGFLGGSDATAVTAPATTWRFAEGFTGGDFETYFLVANPGGSAGTVTLDFFLDSGTTITKTVSIGATSRVTVRARDYPELANAAFATRITGTTPLVAERAMYWGAFQEGHATAGLPDQEQAWVFAEGIAGVHAGLPYETFYLFLNSSPSPIQVTGTFYREDGYGTQQTYTIPANARFTLYGGSVPFMNNQKFGAVFQSTTPFIVERAVYWGVGRYGGTVSTGTRWTGEVATPAEPPTAPPPPPPPPPPPTCTAVVCDNLTGSTTGRVFGGGFDSFGYVVTDDRAGIEWSVPTITKGYFEFELTGMRRAFSDEKYKILAMYDGDFSSGNLYRATVEQRLPPRFSRLKFLTGSGTQYIESDVEIPWNPSDVYRVRLEWGDGRATFIVTSLSGAGRWVLDEGYHHPGGIYAPPQHRVAIGNPDARGGEHGSFPGMRIRNVRIGTR